jgi:hypothetical protein
MEDGNVKHCGTMLSAMHGQKCPNYLFLVEEQRLQSEGHISCRRDIIEPRTL